MVRTMVRRVFARACIAVAMVGVTAGIAHGTDWPQWRGPALNGSSPERGLPERWDPASGLRWSAPLPGEAGSTPVVLGGRIYLSSTDSSDGKRLWAMCLDATSGAELWRRPVDGTGHKMPYSKEAGPSAVVDGARVVFTFGSGEIIAFTLDGAELWRRHLEREFGKLSQLFIYSASPLLYRDRLYYTMLRDYKPMGDNPTTETAVRTPESLDSFLLCVNPADGQTIWKQPRPSDAVGIETRDSYATPIVCEAGPSPRIIVGGADYLTAHDWEGGSETLRVRYNPHEKGYRQRLVPSPVWAGEWIIAARPRYGGVYAVRADATGSLDLPQLAWDYKALGPDAPSPLLYEGRVYAMHDSKKKLVCLDPASGREIWTGDLGGGAIFHASPTGADGKIYCINLNGEVVVVRAGDRFEKLATIAMGGNPVQSSIVAAQGCLFIRTRERLACVAE